VPTAPPRVQARGLLQPRQSPATCGFIDGSPTSIVSCGAGNQCVATKSYIGCCENTNSCSRIFTTCYNSPGSSCDAACSQDRSNLICISTVPYCVQYNYEGGLTGYGCDVTAKTVNVLLSATSPSATVVTTLEVAAETSASAASAASTTGTPSPSTNASSRLSSGSIAGIVVGSLAAVMILLAVLIWLRRRRRSPNQPTTQGAGPREPKELPGSQNIGYRPIPPPSESDILSEYHPPSELEALSLPSSPNLIQKGSSSTPMATIPERNAVHELPGSVAVLPELEPTASENREPSQV